MGIGQAEWLRSISNDHTFALRRFVARLTGDQALVDDVVQLTMLRAWEHPVMLDHSEGEVRAWLFAVARNLVIDSFRSPPHRHEFGVENVPETAGADPTDQILDAWLVADALSCLSPQHRDVVLHFYFHGDTMAEISRSLRIPEGTVKSRLHYALRAMKTALQAKDVTL
ncbi:sigma-70 family RNA polymerase sigma factor [Arthrobacter sp. H5]|uniref:sigma-70 family RNA polymerase sigma factor n=1 Tax=Arthrobacter sp. H5 TaxID=1267973 RepID=UPI0004827EDA|nr:sigma-70 family RNA polymerase sigma factor [Arthrobacter sp. H5]